MADEKKQENAPIAAAEKPEESASSADKKPKAKKGKFDYEKINTDDIRPGMLIRVHQKIIDINPKGEEKERTQIFQGMVIARNHGKEVGATITVRKASGGIGVEKIFPLRMPSLTKFELVRTYRVRQAKPYYLRTTKKRLKE